MKALLVADGTLATPVAGELAALAAAARQVLAPAAILAVCDAASAAGAGAALDGIERIMLPAGTGGNLCAALLAADRIDADDSLLVLAAGELAQAAIPLAPGPLAAWLRSLPASGQRAAVAVNGSAVVDLGWLARGDLLVAAGRSCLLKAHGTPTRFGLADALLSLESAEHPVARVRPGATGFRLEDMMRGWFVGPFTPTALHTPGCEVAVKRFAAGAREALHHHRVATEVTLLLEGRARMGARLLGPGDGIVLPPGTVSEFEALSDVLLVAVKVPGAPDDKFPDAPVQAAGPA
ncbi:MAG: hypothetical protein IT556_11550 [Acetobacteraceae bacterium]|nr:hypothetical protein [Acetobacteraceae bacterium]